MLEKSVEHFSKLFAASQLGEKKYKFTAKPTRRGSKQTPATARAFGVN
jgi:hypothetical protein